MESIAQGLLIYSADPSVTAPVAVQIPCPKQGRGWAYLHVKTAAHASDTTTVTMLGRVNASGGYVALKQSDQSTAVSVAQSGGAATETITTVQLLPDMKIALSGTSTTGANTKVWLEAAGYAARTDN